MTRLNDPKVTTQMAPQNDSPNDPSVRAPLQMTPLNDPRNELSNDPTNDPLSMVDLLFSVPLVRGEHCDGDAAGILRTAVEVRAGEVA